MAVPAQKAFGGGRRQSIGVEGESGHWMIWSAVNSVPRTGVYKGSLMSDKPRSSKVIHPPFSRQLDRRSPEGSKGRA